MCSSASSRASTTTNLAATSKRTIFCSRLPHLAAPPSLPLLNSNSNPSNLWANLRTHTPDSNNNSSSHKACNLNSHRLMGATKCLLRVCPKLCLLKAMVSSQCRDTGSQWASQLRDGVNNQWDNSLCKATVSLCSNQCKVMASPCRVSQCQVSQCKANSHRCRAMECLLSSSNNGACHPSKTHMAVSTNRSELTDFVGLTGQVEA